MKTIHYLAAGTLALLGIVHLTCMSMGSDTENAITVILGIAYLSTAFFLSQEDKISRWWGAILPIIGLLISAPGWRTAPSYLSGYYIVSYAVVIACCLYLIFKDRSEQQTFKMLHR
jgi:hypothetical protein